MFGYESFLFYQNDGKQAISKSEIVRINLQSGEKTFFTNNEISDFAPRLSNDGNNIAYYQQVFEGLPSFKRTTNVFVMQSDGNNSKNITNLTNFNLSFPFITWSPDGNFIGFNEADQSTGSSEYGDIFTIEIKTGIIAKLTNTININDMIMDWK